MQIDLLREKHYSSICVVNPITICYLIFVQLYVGYIQTCTPLAVYLYHEVSQLFRKETRDFCVLQTEQIEGVKYIISIRSVTYPGCPETEDTIRGRVSPTWMNR